MKCEDLVIVFISLFENNCLSTIRMEELNPLGNFWQLTPFGCKTSTIFRRGLSRQVDRSLYFCSLAASREGLAERKEVKHN